LTSDVYSYIIVADVNEQLWVEDSVFAR